MNDFPLLTIAIPTWNRPEAISERLSELAGNVPEGVEIVVYENGESDSTRNAVLPFLNNKIHYLPCPTNQGMLANFLRCIVTRQSEWLWILGDDDAVIPGGITTLVRRLAVQDDTKFITCRPIYTANGESCVVNSVQELFHATSFADALFISSTVWRRSAIQDAVGVFIESSYSMSPQLVSMLQILDANSTNGIVYPDSLVVAKINDHRWSRLEFIKRVPSVLDFVKFKKSREITARAMWPEWLWAAKDSMKEIDTHDKMVDWKYSFWIGFKQVSRYLGFLKYPIAVYFFFLVNSRFRQFGVPWKIAKFLTKRMIPPKF